MDFKFRLRRRVVEDADPYISHQYSGERVGGGVPDAPFSYYTNLPVKFQFDIPTNACPLPFYNIYITPIFLKAGTVGGHRPPTTPLRKLFHNGVVGVLR